MASFKLEVGSAVRRDMRRSPRNLIPRVLEKIQSLADDPMPQGSSKLKGAEARYWIRVGDYRIVYEIDLQLRQVKVRHVGHRREIYRRD